MNRSLLEQKWNVLETMPSQEDFTILRLSADIAANLFIGRSKEGNRCLILVTDNTVNANIPHKRITRLSLNYYLSQRMFVIQLNDVAFFDLFDELILSIFNSISNLNIPVEISDCFKATFSKWIILFESVHVKTLSQERLIGLLGELTTLKHFIELRYDIPIDSIVSAWRGPHNERNDFIFFDFAAEVKTCSASNHLISISSEYQLVLHNNKDLFLYAVYFDFDQKIFCLRELVDTISNMILDRFGSLTEFYDALALSGINLISIDDYDWFKFLPIKIEIYTCPSSFPSLRRNEIDPAIRNVSYELDLKLIRGFLTKEVNL